MLNKDDSYLSVDGSDTNQDRENTSNVMPNGLDFVLFLENRLMFCFILNRGIILLCVLQIYLYES